MLLFLRNCCRLTLNLNGLISKNQKCNYKISILSLSKFSSHSKNVFMPPEEFLKAKENLKNNGATIQQIGNKSVEDILFEMFETNGSLNTGKFLAALASNGIKKTDPRLHEFISQLKEIKNRRQDDSFPESLMLSKDEFRNAIKDNIVLISRALRKHFVIPDFAQFTKYIEEFYWKCKDYKTGKVADYIPQLAKFNPDYWGVSLCTVDGQRYSIGDTDIPFTIQSSGKPINYAIALSELGSDVVHKYVGQESSGRMFNELILDHEKKPHNPMVNAGAIIICSLLVNLIKPHLMLSEKFDWVLNYFKAMAGGEYLGFNNATFLSEREANDRNFAIAYYMRENKCFPDKTVLKDVMDFYFQLCSLEVNCHSVSVMAATLANGGICPQTEEQVIANSAVRDVLSLMHSCGMYNYSGQFAFRIGLPAKSGVSGCMMVVVPNVMGFCCWSPQLDTFGNSVRGVKFCEELVSVFNFHHYDNLRYSLHKKDPRRQKNESKGIRIVDLLFAAATGDVSAMRRHYLSGMDMNLSDYDNRTALHIAAAEGHLECVKFLLKICEVNSKIKDRWGHSPLDEAERYGHQEVGKFLKDWSNKTSFNVKV